MSEAPPSSSDGDGKTGLVERGKQLWSRLQQRRPSIRHSVAAWQKFNDNDGPQYAAAVTYFTFLALFPLALLAVSVAGFILHAHPDELQKLFDNITDNLPGQFGQTLNSTIQTAIRKRGTVGAVGLIGVLLTGLGWIGNLRKALDAAWGHQPDKRNFLLSKAINLMILAGLALATLLSLGLTTVATAMTDQIVRWLNLDDVGGMSVVLRVVALLIPVAGDMLVMWWTLIRLPDAHPPRRVALQGTLLAAVGFEVLKVAGTYTMAATTKSATAGPLAGILAILIWVQLVARFLLFCASLMAVLTEEQNAAAVAEADAAAAAERDAEARRVAARQRDSEQASATRTATLFGLGAAAGAVVALLGSRRRG